MAQDKKVAATGQYNAALLNLDYNQEIVNLNHAIDRVNQTRAEAEEDIGFWESVGQTVGMVVGTVAGSVVGQPVVGAKIGAELGSAGGGMIADHYIGDEYSLYDEIDRGDFKFGFEEMDRYEADYQTQNTIDTMEDRDAMFDAVVDSATDILKIDAVGEYMGDVGQKLGEKIGISDEWYETYVKKDS